MSVEFEPVKLGQRRRRLDPVRFGAIAMVVALMLAVLKPWGAAGDAGDVAPDTQVTASPQDLTGPHATTLDRLIAFDAEAGLLRCEAGVTLAEILALIRD